ncbi:MAG: GGDEF domain-containing protein [Nitrospirae bacterium]|nr:GGDEF domain-containing protein [Nitrospirota bacterium]MCL5286083.1 GGDEF domain-containing protein [Nitrospirota bacterium]
MTPDNHLHTMVPELDDDPPFVRDRIHFLYIGGSIGILSSLAMTAVELSRNEFFRVIPSILFSGVAPFLLLLLHRKPENYKRVLTGFAGLILAQQILGAFLSLNEILMLIWFPVFPLTYFFLLGYRRALWWNGMALGGLALGYVFFPILNRIPPVSLPVFLSSVLAYVVAVLLAWYHYRVIHTYQSRLKFEALFDSLTGALLRKAGIEQLSKLMGQADRIPGMELSVALLDIDDFKPINDQDGHKSGDRVLAQMSESIRHSVRKGDSFVRLGGEEFLLLLPGQPLEESRPFAESLRKRIERDVTRPDGTSVTVSIGLTQYRPGESLGDLLHRADELMYAAKRRGKNAVCWEDSRPVIPSSEGAPTIRHSPDALS